MLRSMENFIGALDLIPAGSHVLCAVSGGADSVCLLHALYHLREKKFFTLSAAHFNHQLRGEEASRDQEFVAQFVRLCCGPQRLGDGGTLPAVELYIGSGDVAGEAKARGICLEEAGRDLRYSFLQRTAGEIGADRIATAHTANDNVETMLFNLARGTGLRGLGGIPPARGNIIRPLLTTGRQEVEDYLAYRGLPHVEDSTNASDDYARNRVRHQVIPVLEEISPGLLARAADTAASLRADEACLTNLARKIAGQAEFRGRELMIPAAEIAGAEGPIAIRALRLLLGRLCGEGKDCAAVHLNALLALCRGTKPSGQVDLPKGYTARREYGALVLAPREERAVPEAGPMPAPGERDFGPWRILCQEEAYTGQPQGPFAFWLDGSGSIELRTRQVGDRLTLMGRPGKTVKKWMIDLKIPRIQRDTLPVFQMDGQVVAVAGVGPDQRSLPRRGEQAWHITVFPLLRDRKE